VTVRTINDEITFIVWDSLETQNFQFSVSSEPLSVVIDKNNWILKGVQEEIINPTFAEGILLVNGVDFNVYDTSIRDAYESKAFWGDYSISFWDCFNIPEGGYPSTLPEPIGHGRIPADVLGRFSSVIWIGNNFQGDISIWYQTSILPYVKAGGNLLLMSRHGQDFINEEMRDYIGISWAENITNTIGNCISDFQGLVSMEFTDTQSFNAVFGINFTDNESTLLFKETASFNDERALGVWKKPAAGGTDRLDGGQFVFISGRPYRYRSQEIRKNVEYILENFFYEIKTDEIENNTEMTIPRDFELYQNYPNPFNPHTMISYQIPMTIKIDLSIYNVLGQKVGILVSEKQKAGHYQVKWDALDLPSGIYYYKITAGDFQKAKKMILLK